MKINIVGWYNEKNAGDEAFRTVFEEHLAGHDLSFAKSIDPASDISILGGGGVMQNGYLRGANPTHPMLALGVDIALNGPRYAAIEALQFKAIYLRSKEYAALAQQQGLPGVQYTPDLVFGIERHHAVEDAQIQEALEKSKRPKIGVILTSEIYPYPNRMQEIQKALAVLQETYDLFFISMYHGALSPDAPVNQQAAQGLDPAKCFFIDHTHDPLAILAVLSRMNRVISMRFHGVILSVVANVPFVSIANPGKHSLFCEQEMLKDYWSNLTEVTAYRITSLIQSLDSDPMLSKQLSEQLVRISTQNRNAVQVLFNRIKQDYLTGIGS
jgi:polysaccharide pyruvyl transferase WcaK-like protein